MLTQRPNSYPGHHHHHQAKRNIVGKYSPPHTRPAHKRYTRTEPDDSLDKSRNSLDTKQMKSKQNPRPGTSYTYSHQSKTAQAQERFHFWLVQNAGGDRRGKEAK